MRAKLLGLVAALGLWGVWSPDACRAQTIYLQPQPSPLGRPLVGPTFSPYYNPYYGPYSPVGPGGFNPGLARPGFQTTPSVFPVQQLLAGQTSALYGPDQATGLPVTGHPAGYFNYSHYYYNRLVGAGGYLGTSGLASGGGMLVSAPRLAPTPTQTGTPTTGQPPKPTPAPK
jgi:hypothetical protein